MCSSDLSQGKVQTLGDAIVTELVVILREEVFFLFHGFFEGLLRSSDAILVHLLAVDRTFCPVLRVPLHLSELLMGYATSRSANQSHSLAVVLGDVEAIVAWILGNHPR